MAIACVVIAASAAASVPTSDADAQPSVDVSALTARADVLGAALAAEDRQLAQLDDHGPAAIVDMVLAQLVGGDFDRHQAQLEDLRGRITAAEAAADAATRPTAPAAAMPPDVHPSVRTADNSALPAAAAPATAPAAVISVVREPTTSTDHPTISDGVQTGGAVPSTPKAKALAAAWLATRYAGVAYRWAGASPEGGFDCSGLVVYAWGTVGVQLPHSTYDLYRLGHHVAKDQLEEGDLVFFDGLGHVGIYVGNDTFVQAPHTGDVVRLTTFSTRGSYVGAVRLDT